MAKEVTLVFLTDWDQSDTEWQRFFDSILDDFEVGHAIEITQEDV